MEWHLQLSSSTHSDSIPSHCFSALPCILIPSEPCCPFSNRLYIYVPNPPSAFLSAFLTSPYYSRCWLSWETLFALHFFFKWHTPFLPSQTLKRSPLATHMPISSPNPGLMLFFKTLLCRSSTEVIRSTSLQARSCLTLPWLHNPPSCTSFLSQLLPLPAAVLISFQLLSWALTSLPTFYSESGFQL